jgi:hypothetical protein
VPFPADGGHQAVPGQLVRFRLPGSPSSCFRTKKTALICARQPSSHVSRRMAAPNRLVSASKAISTLLPRPASLAVLLRRSPSRTEGHHPLCRTKRSDGNGRCFRCSSRSWR